MWLSTMAFLVVTVSQYFIILPLNGKVAQNIQKRQNYPQRTILKKTKHRSCTPSLHFPLFKGRGLTPVVTLITNMYTPLSHHHICPLSKRSSGRICRSEGFTEA